MIAQAVLLQSFISEGKSKRVMAHPKGFRWSVDFPDLTLAPSKREGRQLAPYCDGEPLSSSTPRRAGSMRCLSRQNCQSTSSQ